MQRVTPGGANLRTVPSDGKTCWFGQFVEREFADELEQELLQAAALHRSWKSYRTSRDLNPDDIEQLRRHWYGYPPVRIGDRAGRAMLDGTACVWAGWTIYSLLMNVFLGGAAAWHAMAGG
ncbi:hypothetical protein Q9Q95_13245 [Sphingomonas sp. DG1-23]|uniref:hypothetical protein n=1 Tax=Sphingomonas sp. DG1-23 TaxID=3068316 RepID=UPI00273E63FF|nr:hypothetical protein [Sphingomonas sp. DG1-23]MDP5279894.1 hypothetical protein [Sphingomonas sp. DG1-23]